MTVPYLSQSDVIAGNLPLLGASLTELFGVGVATGVCLLLHVGSFFSKLVVVVWSQTLIAGSLPRFRSDQIVSLCWKALLPLALLNVFATAAVMLLLGAA